MAVIFEQQTEEWKWLYNQCMIAQAQTQRYLEMFPNGFTKEEVDNMIDWDKLDAMAKHATPEEVGELSS